MSIESIINRIQNEADEYAKECMAEAEAQKKVILDDARAEADTMLVDIKERAAKDADILIERRESVAGLDSRKMQLAAKQEIITESFDKALDKLVALDENEYLGFIKAQLDNYKDEGGEILLNEADASKFGSKLADYYAATNLRLADENVDIKGGFILRQGDIAINCSVEKLLDNQKEEVIAEVASKLFPEG